MRQQYNSLLKRGKSGVKLRPRKPPGPTTPPGFTTPPPAHAEPPPRRQTPVFVYAVELSPGPDGALADTKVHGVPLSLGESSALVIQCAARTRAARRPTPPS